MINKTNTKTSINAHDVTELTYVDEKYSLGRLLGRGSYGKVYLANKKGVLRKCYAVKKYSLRIPKDVKIDEAFCNKCVHEHNLREIQILKTLDHPNIIKLEETCVDEKGDLCLVFPYYDIDLDRFINLGHNKHLTLVQMKTMFKEILSALAHLETKQIMHRDLKPSNIMLTDDRSVKLIDFGQSRHMNTDCRHKLLPMNLSNTEYVRSITEDNGPTIKELYDGPYTPNACTAWYRSPEMYLCTMNYDHRSDIWSAGLIFWEVFSALSDNYVRLFGNGDDDSTRQKIFEVVGLGDVPKCSLLSAATRKLFNTHRAHYKLSQGEQRISKSLMRLIRPLSNIKLPRPSPIHPNETIEDARMRVFLDPSFRTACAKRKMNPDDYDLKNLKHLILLMLRIDPNRRPPASRLLKHSFFG